MGIISWFFMKYLSISYNPGIVLTAEDTVVSKNFPVPLRNILFWRRQIRKHQFWHDVINAITMLSRMLDDNLAHTWESERAPWGCCGSGSLKDRQELAGWRRRKWEKAFGLRKQRVGRPRSFMNNWKSVLF